MKNESYINTAYPSYKGARKIQLHVPGMWFAHDSAAGLHRQSINCRRRIDFTFVLNSLIIALLSAPQNHCRRHYKLARRH